MQLAIDSASKRHEAGVGSRNPSDPRATALTIACREVDCAFGRHGSQECNDADSDTEITSEPAFQARRCHKGDDHNCHLDHIRILGQRNKKKEKEKEKNENENEEENEEVEAET